MEEKRGSGGEQGLIQGGGSCRMISCAQPLQCSCVQALQGSD